MKEHIAKDGILSKIYKEEQAIAVQIKRYKTQYASKNGQPKDVNKQLKMIKQLNMLLMAHCKNTILISPERALTQVQQMSSLLQDITNKYEQLNSKYQCKFGNTLADDIKAIHTSQLCYVCSQTIKKAQIERIKNHLLNQKDLYAYRYGEEESPKLDDDQLFFAQVNKLLNNKQTDIMKNQKMLGNFHQTVMDSLETLLNIQKDFLNKDSMPAPSQGWLREAKKQMQFLLKDAYSGKIPPWISKMLQLFTSLHFRHKFDKMKDIQIQTDVSTNSEMVELKKKHILSMRKLEEAEHLSKSKEKDLISMVSECQLLETKVGYYKAEINRLIEQIDRLKHENKIVQNKLLNINTLNKSRRSRRQDDLLESHINEHISKYSNHQMKTHKSIRKQSTFHNQSDGQLLPKILESKNKKKQQRSTNQSRTSIKINSTAQSQNKQKKSGMFSLLHKVSNVSRNSSQQDLRATHRSENSSSSQRPRNDDKQHSKLVSKDQKTQMHQQLNDMSLKNTIPEVEGQSNLEEERNKVKQVNEQLRQVIKHGINVKKHSKHSRQSLALPGLKKTTRKINYDNVPLELQRLADFKMEYSQNYTNSPSEIAQQVETNRIASLYNELKDKGYLIKISQDEFKMVIKIKAFNFGSKSTLEAQTLDETILARNANRTKKIKRFSPSKRQLTQLFNLPDHYKTVRPSFYSPSSSFKQKSKDYSALFASSANAFQYESSFNRAPLKINYALTKTEQKLSRELFAHLNTIKNTDENKYKQLCSYIRYPFQVMQDNIGIMSISQLKENNFGVCFQRIAALHSRCKKQDGLCQHLSQVRHKILKNVIFNQTI